MLALASLATMALEQHGQSSEFSAAHSMDTTWFAVDADGCVGVFDTSEGGALPNAAASGGGAGDPSFDTFPLEAALLAAALVDDPELLAEWRTEPAGAPRAVREGARAIVVLADPRLTDGSRLRTGSTSASSCSPSASPTPSGSSSPT